MNPKVSKWFDTGQAREALVGDGSFYIHAPAFAVHDRLYLVDQLQAWAEGDADRLSRASLAVTEAVHSLLKAARTDEAIDLLLAIVVATDDDEKSMLPLDPTKVNEALFAAERDYRDRGVLTTQTVNAIGRIRKMLVAPSG